MRTVITGGAGFIGSNYAHRLIGRGEDVLLLDDFSGPSVHANLRWLREEHGETSFRVVRAALEDPRAVERACEGAEVVVHLGGQTAVTTSVSEPRHDFEANALGTLNVLEAVRRHGGRAVVLYASTNKVYGGLEALRWTEQETRWVLADLPDGIAESQPLDFVSPYGCSKGAGDQYVRDYARIYGLRTVVFRQSCIYGPQQMGLEAQGWLAWFFLAARDRRPLTIFGDGKQVRDLLFVEDLLDAYDLAVARIGRIAGEVYNVGGGPERSISVWVELAPMLEARVGRSPEVTFSGWRPGDQRVYVSDTRKARRDLGWEPRTSLEAGLSRLAEWVRRRAPALSR